MDMKTKPLFLFAWLMLAITGCSAGESQTDFPETPPTEKPEEPIEPSGDKKVLVVYFSHTGNTRTIAGYIHDTVKSDLVGSMPIPMITMLCWHKSGKKWHPDIARL